MTDSVLIVDDSLTVRMDLAEAFQLAGFRPLPCATAAEARVALAREPVALVILDVVLPDGDGTDLVREIRSTASLADTAVLILSTEAEVEARIRGLETGADDYVGKPYDTGYIIARGRELLQRRSQRVPDDRPLVLVIDDSPTYRAELERALETAGYAVATAATGEQGLFVAAAHPPAAILVDGVLPGIDGATVVRRIRLDAALRGIPCVLLTASDERGAEIRALDSGADAFVRKTEDVDMVLARLAAVRRSAHATLDAAASLPGPKRILAVDDSLTYLHALAAMLRGEGYDVVLAHSGEEAIEMLAGQPVDCILLDMLMPGLSGTETCSRIKSSPVARDIPLLMLTAMEEREAMIQGLAAGADDYIPKSGDFEVLKARLRAQLRRKQFEDENRKIREELLHREIDATEARGVREVAEARAVLVDELERKNKELETFSYSVSHDLRGPLRSIDGFSQALLEDYGEALDDHGRDYLRRVRVAAQEMGELIDGLLTLSRVERAGLSRSRVSVSEIARRIADELGQNHPERPVAFAIAPGLTVEADRPLVRALLDNLIGNAWKFTGKSPSPRIELGATEHSDGTVYFVRDNGAGFDMAYAEKLFRPFQRLHSEGDFPGTGIGLATVQRIVERHGGRVWAEGAVGRGATVFFTLPANRSNGGHS